MDLKAVVGFLQHSLVVKGAIAGVVAAARVDLKAFREAQKRGDAGKFVDDFNWTVARRRYVAGALWGALTGGALDGFGALS